MSLALEAATILPGRKCLHSILHQAILIYNHLICFYASASKERGQLKSERELKGIRIVISSVSLKNNFKDLLWKLQAETSFGSSHTTNTLRNISSNVLYLHTKNLNPF